MVKRFRVRTYLVFRPGAAGRTPLGCGNSRRRAGRQPAETETDRKQTQKTQPHLRLHICFRERLRLGQLRLRAACRFLCGFLRESWRLELFLLAAAGPRVFLPRPQFDAIDCCVASRYVQVTLYYVTSPA